MNISKKRLRREIGHILDHLSMHPERDFEDLHAVLTGKSKVSVKLRIADEILQGHGVEALTDHRADGNGYHGDCIAEYVNMGDTYAVTLLYDFDKLHITTWGDWFERWERKLPRAQQ